MTAQSIGRGRRRRRRKAARGRLPFDLITLVLIVAAIYLTARLWPPQSAPVPAAPPPAAQEAPPVPVLPALPALEPASEPRAARRPARRAPQHVVPDAAEAAPHDPFAGLQPLSAQELDAISQAR